MNLCRSSKWLCNLVGSDWDNHEERKIIYSNLLILPWFLQFLYYLNAFVNKSDFNSFLLIDSFYWKHLAFSCPLDFCTYLRASLCIVPVSWGDGVALLQPDSGPYSTCNLLVGRVSRSLQEMVQSWNCPVCLGFGRALQPWVFISGALPPPLRDSLGEDSW